MFAIIKMRHQPNTFSFMTILEWTLNQIKCNYVQPGWYKSYCGEINSWVLTNICQRENEADLISHFEHSVLDLKTHWKFTSSLAPSGTLVFIMGYFIHTYKPSFPNFSNLEQSCLYTFIIHFHFHSVFNIQNRTRQYFCMNYIDNACMYKFLQDSTRFFRFL